jgi:hypothetical protein
MSGFDLKGFKIPRRKYADIKLLEDRRRQKNTANTLRRCVQACSNSLTVRERRDP